MVNVAESIIGEVNAKYGNYWGYVNGSYKMKNGNIHYFEFSENIMGTKEIGTIEIEASAYRPGSINSILLGSSIRYESTKYYSFLLSHFSSNSDYMFVSKAHTGNVIIMLTDGYMDLCRYGDNITGWEWIETREDEPGSQITEEIISEYLQISDVNISDRDSILFEDLDASSAGNREFFMIDHLRNVVRIPPSRRTRDDIDHYERLAGSNTLRRYRLGIYERSEVIVIEYKFSRDKKGLINCVSEEIEVPNHVAHIVCRRESMLKSILLTDMESQWLDQIDDTVEEEEYKYLSENFCVFSTGNKYVNLEGVWVLAPEELIFSIMHTPHLSHIREEITIWNSL